MIDFDRELNSCNEEMKRVKSKKKRLTQAKEILMNEGHKEVIKILHQEVMDYFGITYSIDYDDIFIVVRHQGLDVILDGVPLPYNTDYDNIAHKIDLLYGKNKAEASFERSIKYKGICFITREAQIATIPEEEMELLKSLGKVEVEIIEASEETRIFCPN